VLLDFHSQLDLEEGEYCDVGRILAASCAGSSCHESSDGTPPWGGVELFAPDVSERLLDVAPSYPWNPECASTPRLLINSAAPEESYLLQKVERTADCG
jgi:hypothetical protein